MESIYLCYFRTEQIADGELGTNTGGSGTGTEGKGIGGVFAAVHGAGEKIRGEFNAGVDRAFDEV